MRQQVLLCVSAVCVLGIFTRNILADDKAYKIIFHRDVTVGQQFQLKVSGTVKRVYKWKQPDEKQPDPEQYAAKLDAVEKVLAIEPNSHSASKVEFTIKSFTRDKVELLAPGTIVVGESLTGDSHFTISGQDVDPQMQDMLDQLLIDLHAANDPHTLDEEIGTDKPVKVGETWQSNRAIDAAASSSPHGKVAEADITGILKLESVEPTPAGPLLHIKRTTEIRKMSCDWDDDRKMDRGTVLNEVEMILPYDTSNLRFEFNETMKNNIDFSVKSPDGSIDVLNMKMDLTRRSLEVPIEEKAVQHK